MIVLFDAEILGQEVAADFQRSDAGAVGVQGERDELIHERQVVDGVAVGRLAEGCHRLREMGPALPQFEAFFDVTYGREVLFELGLILLVDLSGETLRFLAHGIEDRSLHLVFLFATDAAIRGVANEKLVEEFGWVGDRWYAYAGLRPRELATAMDAALGADGERGEPGLVAELLSEELVERDVSVWAVLCLGVEHAREEGMHREVAAFDAVVEATENGHQFALRPDGLQQGRLFVVASGGGREKLLGLVAEQVADRHEAAGADAGTFGHLHGGISAESLCAERA